MAWPTSTAPWLRGAREVVKAEDVIDYTRRDNVAERLARKFRRHLWRNRLRGMRSAPALR